MPVVAIPRPGNYSVKVLSYPAKRGAGGFDMRYGRNRAPAQLFISRSICVNPKWQDGHIVCDQIDGLADKRLHSLNAVLDAILRPDFRQLVETLNLCKQTFHLNLWCTASAMQ